jgi:hydroxyethylthiazole kinase
MAELDLAERTAASLERIRKQTPLVHNITNFVVMNDTANVLLAIGASPVMAHAISEVREMVSFAGALVLNIGTLDTEWVESMLIAGLEANERNVPVVLDPVGAGATAFRTAATQQILDTVKMAAVRGNAGELASIAGLHGKVRGVDSVSADSPETAALIVARRTGGAAVASGAIDYVAGAPAEVQPGTGRPGNGAASSGGAASAGAAAIGGAAGSGPATGAVPRLAGVPRLAEIRNGDPFMGRITGSGCMATALVGAFLAVERDPFLAAAEAMIAFGIAGEAAARISAGPGTFRANLIDAVANLNRAQILAETRAAIKESRGA